MTRSCSRPRPMRAQARHAVESRRGRRRGRARAGASRAGLAVTLVEIDADACGARARECGAQRACRSRAGRRRSTSRRPTRDFATAGLPPGQRRARADESAVQRSGATECLARSRSAASRMRRRATRWRDGCGRAAVAARAVGHADADLARGWTRRCARGACAGFGAIAVLPIYPRAGRRGDPRPGARRQRRAARRSRCCPA